MTQLGIRGRLAQEIASLARVRWALKSFYPFKSPVPDGIYPALLQRAGDPIIGPLVRLARASLTLGYVPKAYLFKLFKLFKSNIIPILTNRNDM